MSSSLVLPGDDTDLGRGHRVRVGAAAVPARAARRRPGRRREARRRARDPLAQEGHQDLGLDLAIRAVDLTTLEGADTPGKVRSLCAKARQPDPADPDCPPVAAVCVYPDLVATAVEALRGSGIHVASVATAFPSGRSSLDIKLQDTRDAVAAGADEIDMVIDRGAFLAGNYGKVLEEIVAVEGGLRRRPPQGDPRDRRT